jgi:ABC-2 type transport system ATP-binding protein
MHSINALTVKNIGFRLKESNIFNNFSHEFSIGGIYPIIGENGCGKTTLLKILSGLQKPDTGNIFYSGKALYPNPQNFRKHIGYAPVQSFFYPHLSLNENLELIALSRNLTKQRFKQFAPTILKICSLTEKADVLIKKFSDGYIKRALIAQALIHQPKYLFLDEPCALLDSSQRDKLWDLLTKLHEQNITTIFSTHHSTEANKAFGASLLLDMNGLSQQHNFTYKILEREQDKDDEHFSITGKS